MATNKREARIFVQIDDQVATRKCMWPSGGEHSSNDGKASCSMAWRVEGGTNPPAMDLCFDHATENFQDLIGELAAGR